MRLRKAQRIVSQANPHAGGWVALPPSAAGTGVADRTTGAERGYRTLQRLPAAATALAALDLDGTLQSPSLVAERRFNVPSRHDHRVAPARCKRQLLPVVVPMASRRPRARSSQARSGRPQTARRSGESSRIRPSGALTTLLAACVEGKASPWTGAGTAGEPWLHPCCRTAAARAAYRSAIRKHWVSAPCTARSNASRRRPSRTFRRSGSVPMHRTPSRWRSAA